MVNMEHNCMLIGSYHSICYTQVIGIKFEALALQVFPYFVIP